MAISFTNLAVKYRGASGFNASTKVENNPTIISLGDIDHHSLNERKVFPHVVFLSFIILQPPLPYSSEIELEISLHMIDFFSLIPHGILVQIFDHDQ